MLNIAVMFNKDEVFYKQFYVKLPISIFYCEICHTSAHVAFPLTVTLLMSNKPPCISLFTGIHDHIYGCGFFFFEVLGILRVNIHIFNIYYLDFIFGIIFRFFSGKFNNCPQGL